MLGCCSSEDAVPVEGGLQASDPAAKEGGDFISDPNKVWGIFDEIGIGHKTQEHEFVVTIEEEKKVTHHLPGHHTINMFVKDYKGKKGKLYLISLPHDAKWDFKTLGASQV